MPKASKSGSIAAKKQPEPKYPVTLDGHYFVVRGRLWRCTNPALSKEEREEHTKTLMDARRHMRKDQPENVRSEAKTRVQEAKVALGERGPVWWSASEGEVCDRKMAKNTTYRDWFDSLSTSGTGRTDSHRNPIHG